MTRALTLALLAACSSSDSTQQPKPTAQRAAPIANASPNDMYARGAPTFIVGTAGDDAADRSIAAQVDLIRGIAFPSARAIDDTAVDAWPEVPVVYGGPHVNAALAKVEASLPFALSRGRLAIGGRTFEGDAYRLIAVVPADGDRPELLVYAGTGDPGVGEINAVTHGDDPILIADEFGPLVTGRWERGDDGAIRAALGKPARRIEWRDVARDHVTFRFPKTLPAAATEAELIDTCMRGVATAVRKLAIEHPAPMVAYVYPDHRSKQSLTGDSGDGHAVVSSRTLHVVAAGALESLVAHEATHLLGYDAWGPAGTPAMGEGLAVWVSGSYGGRPLAEYRGGFDAPPSIAELLGPSFRKLPEPTSYPLAGMLVEVAVREVGIAGVRDHLIGASPATWAAACEAAGTTADRLQLAFSRYFAP